MNYITIKIKNEDTITDYLLFHADYLNEAWIAEVKEDESIRIVREFTCHDVMNCLDEIARCTDYLGTVTQIIGNDFEPAVVQALREKLLCPQIDKSPVFRLPLSLSLQSRTGFWNRLTKAFPDLGMAG